MVVNRIKSSKEFPKLFSVMVDQFFMSITTFATTIILARTFDKIIYADFVLLISISLFILGLQSALISKPFAINISEYVNNSEADFLKFNMQSKLIFTLLFIIIFPIAYYLIFKEIDLKKIFFYALFIVSYSFYFFIRETMLSIRNTKQNLYYGLGCAVSILLILTIIWIYQITDVYFYLGCVSFVYLILTGVYFIKNFKQHEVSRTTQIKFLKINWRTGKWLTGTNFLYYLSVDIYPWLLLYLTTKNEVAMLGVLASIASITNPILKALSSYLLPVYVRFRDDVLNFKKLINKWLFFFGILSIVLFLSGYFFGVSIIHLFFGSKYTNMEGIVIFPFALQALVIFFQPIKIALMAIKRTDIDFWIYIPRSIIAVFLGYFLVNKFGIYGVFYTMIVENVFYQGMLLFYFNRLKRINIV